MQKEDNKYAGKECLKDINNDHKTKVVFKNLEK